MTRSKSAIRIGLMAPLTGLVELYGTDISRAGQIATEEINESGGVLGRPLELVIVDDGSLPDTAVPAANRLVDEEKCVAIIGNLLSNSRISVANMVADTKKIPYLNFSFHEGAIWSRYFFHFAALPNQQIDKMIPYMAQAIGPKMFFAGTNYEWPRGSIDAAKISLLKVGGEIVGEVYLPIGTSNFDELLDSVAASGADVFVPYFAGSDQTNLLTQFTERGLKKRMSVVMGHYDEAMVGLLPPDVREGFYSSNTYFMGVDTPENKAYMDRLAQHPDVTGIWPDGNGVLTNFSEGTYLCVKAFAAAVEAAGTVDAEALVDALEGLTIKGPQGTVRMDPATHHAWVNTHLSRCNADGTFEIIKSFGTLPPEIPKRYRELFPALVAGAGLQEQEQGRNRTLSEIEIAPDQDAVSIQADETGIITEVNAQATKLFGFSADEMIGMSIHMLLPPHLRDQHKSHFLRFLESDQMSISMGTQGDVFGYRKDGSQFPALAAVVKIKRAGAWLTVATMFDISDQIKDQENLNRQTTHDALTGLLNRNQIIERLSSALERSRTTGNLICAVLIDLRSFGLINETCGYETGDEILVSVAETLMKVVNPGDTVGRFGGDEFLVVCEHQGEDAGSMAYKDRLLQSICQSVTAKDGTVSVDVDIKITKGNGQSSSIDSMLSDITRTNPS